MTWDKTGLPFSYLHPKVQEAILTGDDFVNGVMPWPSTWYETVKYKGFDYQIKPNAQGHSVWYGPYHIGQVKCYGAPTDARYHVTTGDE